MAWIELTKLLCEKVDKTLNKCQALILSPGRERLASIQEFITNIGIPHLECSKDIKLRENIRQLESGAAVIVGTPGRVQDLIKRNDLHTNDIKMLILDEADQLLMNDFKHSVELTLDALPVDVQVVLFSSSPSIDVIEVNKTLMRDPPIFLVKRFTRESMKHFYVNEVDEERKMHKVLSICESVPSPSAKVLIFTKTLRMVDQLKEVLSDKNLAVVTLTGNVERDDRECVLKQLRNGTAQILVTTDCAFAVDLPEMSLIINYELPLKKDYYCRYN